MSDKVIFPATEIELDLPISAASLHYIPPTFKRISDGTMVVGYLAYDSDAENPLEACDGEGRIYSFNRRHNNFCSDLAATMAEHKGNEHMVIPLSYYEHGMCLWDVQHGERISSCPDQQWDVAPFAGIWAPEGHTLESIKTRVIHDLLPKGVSVDYKSKHNPDGTCITRPPKPGEKPYFKDGTCIDERYSNIITLTMPDGSEHAGYKSFATAYASARKRLGVEIDPKALKDAEHKLAVAYAASACKLYTNWCNGECYGYVVAWFDHTGEYVEHDSCWGYYTQEECNEALEDAFFNAVTRLERVADKTQEAVNCP